MSDSLRWAVLWGGGALCWVACAGATPDAPAEAPRAVVSGGTLAETTDGDAASDAHRHGSEVRSCVSLMGETSHLLTHPPTMRHAHIHHGFFRPFFGVVFLMGLMCLIGGVEICCE